MISLKRLGLVACMLVLAMLAMAPIAQAADNAHGGLYVTGGSTGQTLATSAAKLTAFTDAMAASSSSNDGDQSVTPVAASDYITLAAGGTYEIRWVACATADATTRVTYTLRDGSTAITGATASINHVASTAMTTGISFLYKPTSSCNLSVYAVAASGTPAVTVIDSQLVVVRLK